jgi:hypothetical protein
MFKNVFFATLVSVSIATQAQATEGIHSFNGQDLSSYEAKIVNEGYTLDQIVTEYFPEAASADHKARTLFKVELAKLIFQDETTELAKFDEGFYSVLDQALTKLEDGYREKAASITIVAQGNIFVGDNLLYGNIEQDAVAFTAVKEPTNIFAMDSNGTDLKSTTDRNDFFIEDQFANSDGIGFTKPAVDLEPSYDGKGGLTISVEPKANDKIYLVDGNLWVHMAEPFSFILPSESTTPTTGGNAQIAPAIVETSPDE